MFTAEWLTNCIVCDESMASNSFNQKIVSLYLVSNIFCLYTERQNIKKKQRHTLKSKSLVICIRSYVFERPTNQCFLLTELSVTQSKGTIL